MLFPEVLDGQIPIVEVIDILRASYGQEIIPESVRLYPSYDDQNIYFRDVSGRDQQFKIHSLGMSGQTREVQQMQDQQLQLVAKDPYVFASEVLPPFTGDFAVISQSTEKVGRLLTFVPGTVLCDVEQTDTILNRLGSTLGRYSKVVETYTHPCMRRVSEWNMLNALQTLDEFQQQASQLLSSIEADITAKVYNDQVNQVRVQYTTVMNIVHTLPHLVIHGDANDFNVVQSSQCALALIDFGDSMHNPRVFDQAISTGYFLLHKADPVHTALQITKGYLSQAPLSQDERNAIFPAALMRITVSLTMALVNFAKNPTNLYMLSTANPGITLLQHQVNTHGSIQQAVHDFNTKLNKL